MTDLQKDNYFKTVKGRYVQWTGTIENVDKNEICVKCLDTTLTYDFIAIVSSSEYDLSNLQKGSHITIKGKISQQEGNIMPWALNNSSIIK